MYIAACMQSVEHIVIHCDGVRKKENWQVLEGKGDKGCEELLLYTASLLGGTRQWNSCALPQCLGTLGRGNLFVHCLTTLGHWVVELLLYIASLLRGSG